MAILPELLELQVVTPNHAVVREEVHEAQVPAKGGYLGILPGHAPLLSELQLGELSYRKGPGWSYLTVFGGFVEVLADRIIVLAEVAERGEEIEVERAREAQKRAEERLKRVTDPEIDQGRAQLALRRAQIRLQVAAEAGAGRALAPGRLPQEPSAAP